MLDSRRALRSRFIRALVRPHHPRADQLVWCGSRESSRHDFRVQRVHGTEGNGRERKAQKPLREKRPTDRSSVSFPPSRANTSLLSSPPNHPRAPAANKSLLLAHTMSHQGYAPLPQSGQAPPSSTSQQLDPSVVIEPYRPEVTAEWLPPPPATKPFGPEQRTPHPHTSPTHPLMSVHSLAYSSYLSRWRYPSR